MLTFYLFKAALAVFLSFFSPYQNLHKRKINNRGHSNELLLIYFFLCFPSFLWKRGGHILYCSGWLILWKFKVNLLSYLKTILHIRSYIFITNLRLTLESRRSLLIFSSAKLKAQVSFSDRLLFVRPSVCL